MPQRVDTCSAAQDALPSDPAPAFHRWAGQNNANWTAASVPWDPDSQIQLTAAALTPGARAEHRPIDPVSRIGVTSRVRNWDNPYAGDDISSDPCSSAVSIYDVQPYQPGYLVPAVNDSTDGTMMQQRYNYQAPSWSHAAGPYGGPYRPLRACPHALGLSHSCPEDLGIESDLVSDGPYETWALGRDMGAAAEAARPPPRRETLRSRGAPRATDGCLSGLGCGLGSTWIDPRFDPGPAELFDGGDAVWAHGGHAGGPTFGSFTPSAYTFGFGGGSSRYVRGAGDGHLIAPWVPFRERA